MHTDTEEYLPSSATQRPKVFTLHRAEDETTQRILDARMKVLHDHALTPESRMVFAYLLDLSVRRDSYYLFGSVCISYYKLSQEMGACQRSIYNWLFGNQQRGKLGLVSRGYLWVSHDFVSNMWARNVYHVEELDPKKQSREKMDDGAHYGNGATRGKAPEAQGARQPGQPFLPGVQGRSVTLFDHRGQPLTPSDFAQVVDVAGGTGNKLRAAPATGCGSDRQHVAGETGNMLRARPATCCGPDPQHVAGGTGNTLRAAPATGCALKEAKVRAEAAIERGEAQPAEAAQTPPESLRAWEEGLKDCFPSRLEAIKSDLLQAQRAADPADEETQADLATRIAIVEKRIYGRALSRPKKAPMPRKFVTPATTAPKEPTEDELREGAQYLIDAGMADKMTTAQKEIVKRWAKRKKMDAEARP